MTRRVFYSFHHAADCWRTSQVRGIGSIDGNKPVSDNDWEAVKKGGDKQIQAWIDNQLNGRTCTILLIGQNTADRKWIDYEIEQSWSNKLGIVGIHIHNLKDSSGLQAQKGKNPFDSFKIKSRNATLSSIVKAYDPPYLSSKDVYDYISQNLVKWVEEAIKIRDNYHIANNAPVI